MANASSGEWPPGEGEMARGIREFDWATTPLGALDTWPESLRTSVRLMLNSGYPMFLWWGRDLINFYNDNTSVLGPRHRGALGQPASQVWAEIWGVVGPQAKVVMAEGRLTWNEAIPLVLTRHGYAEETYFSFFYCPAYGEDGQVSGIFCVCTEDTAKVLSRRRLKTLHDFGERLSQYRTAEHAMRAAADTLAENPNDVPFALIYLLSEDGDTAQLVSSVRFDESSAAAPSVVDMNSSCDPWVFGPVLQTGRSQILEDLSSRFGSLSAGAWPDDVTTKAIILPLPKGVVQNIPAGFLIVGISPRLQFSDQYGGFLERCAGHIGIAIANVRVYRDERKSCDARGEIDRAKTLCFSNISDELRTTQTLMLGPLADALAVLESPVSDRERHAIAYRNSLRLLKHVNSLLDFSRIEARQTQAFYQSTDLAALTSKLANNFRSVCERAGLLLVVDCPPLPEPVYVDRDLWEVVILNLLSNAFKFAFEGGLSIALRAMSGLVELSIADTGIGVPEREVPTLFERFRRIEGQEAHAYDGSGIGLTLVYELVKLHGGTIDARRKVGRGTTFTIRLPFGKAHLPPDRIGVKNSLSSNSVSADDYIQTAPRWRPDAAPLTEEPGAYEPAGDIGTEPAARVLYADSDPDMRTYVRRLLGAHYEVQTVADGEAALTAINEHRPDLVLTDFRVSSLDGRGLLHAIRAQAKLHDLPVIILSAVAHGHGAAGANDYLVKPFSSRELLARVSNNLGLARFRQDALAALRKNEEKFRRVLSTDAVAIFFVNREDVLIDANEAFLQLTGYSRDDLINRRLTWRKLTPPEWMAQSEAQMKGLAATGRIGPYEKQYLRKDGTRSWMLFAGRDLGDGTAVKFAIDINERKRIEQALRESQERLSKLVTLLPAAIYTCDAEGRLTYFNHRAVALWGREPRLGDPTEKFCGSFRMWKSDGSLLMHDQCPMADAVREGCSARNMEVVIEQPSGARLVADVSIDPLYDGEGRLAGAINVFFDVTERKRTEDALREGDARLRSALQAGRMAYWTWSAAKGVTAASDTMDELFGLLPHDKWRSSKEGFELLHPDDYNRHRDLVERSREAGRGWHSIFRIVRPRDGQIAWLEERAEPSHDAKTGEGRITGLVWDITEQKQAAERQKVLVAELQHRTRNLLGVVRSITNLTLARSGSLEEFGVNFRERLEALARANALLSRLSEGDRVTFNELIRTELSGLGITDGRGHEEQVNLCGPEKVRLRSSTVQTLALALHELATNALKHGALSRPKGRLSVRWSLQSSARGERRLEIEWLETGGSARLRPEDEAERKGYGRELIERALPYQFRAETTYVVTPEGVRCTIKLPISTMQEDFAHA